MSISHFYIEFTGDDRLRIEPKMINNQLKSFRIKYQAAKKTDKVNYSVEGFEPFFEYEWLTIVKYDNLKGESIKDFMRPTPVTFSPHGLHVKESWGMIDNMQFLNNVMIDMKYWVETRTKYDLVMGNISDQQKEVGNNNMLRTVKLVNFLFNFSSIESVNAFNNIYTGQTLIPIPLPEEDDWTLEQNSIAANRIEKRAIKGDPDILVYGAFRALSYQRSGEEIAV
ncbi:MAG: hypothetical protein H7263_06890 [Candidatus Sericytochromatia bacterium]|nr:hypothetical protein [Candidatus Sericytochromatia bacterium]